MWSFDRAERRQQAETEALSRLEPDDFERAIVWMPRAKAALWVLAVAGGGALVTFMLGWWP